MFTRAATAAVMASAWLVSAQDSTTDNNAYHPHAAFVFVRTGERTPILRNGAQKLTALGANQMYTLGENFRSRYISGNDPHGLGVEHIAGMSTDILDDAQIEVQTLERPYLVASAQAFMQGLYPPHGISNGTGDVTGLLADGTVMDYPLNGYQYANTQVFGDSDPNSIELSGAQNCPMAQRDAMMYFTTDQFLETKAANEDLYQSLDVDWFEGNLEERQLDFTHAIEIADYLTYQYTHNTTIHDTLENSSTYTDTYTKLHYLADELSWYVYGNTTTSPSPVRAIGGQTLASAILSHFSLLIADKNNTGDQTDLSYPLTFNFGEQDAMMSLLSLMEVDYKDLNFRSIPPYGSAMVFELFSTGAYDVFPTNPADLWVSFYFHNGTSFESQQLMRFPMFNSGPTGTEIPWTEFKDMFERIGMSELGEWCESCNSASMFCSGAVGGDATLIIPGAHQSKNEKISPAVAGVIGAVVTLVVAGALFALAMLFFGVRLHRNPPSRKNSAESHLGGFKGSSKLASDPDLSLAKNGAPVAGIVSFSNVGDEAGRSKGHERVGSWELRQKDFGKDVGRDGSVSPRESFDGIDAVAARPVVPVERV